MPRTFCALRLVANGRTVRVRCGTDIRKRNASHGSTAAQVGYEVLSVPATGVEPTRIAVIGYGCWGSNHVRVLRSLPTSARWWSTRTNGGSSVQ